MEILQEKSEIEIGYIKAKAGEGDADAPKGAKITCPRCGEENDMGTNYCRKCGEKLSK